MDRRRSVSVRNDRVDWFYDRVPSQRRLIVWSLFAVLGPPRSVGCHCKHDVSRLEIFDRKHLDSVIYITHQSKRVLERSTLDAQRRADFWMRRAVPSHVPETIDCQGDATIRKEITNTST